MIKSVNVPVLVGQCSEEEPWSSYGSSGEEASAEWRAENTGFRVACRKSVSKTVDMIQLLTFLYASVSLSVKSA